jgi:hypothetical protein
VKTVRRVAGYTLLVNVECQSLAEADEAITAGANIVMLDNIVGEELHSAAKELKEKWKGKREFLIETSGGIVEGLGPDIDILSTSAVHQVSQLVWRFERSELMSRAVNMSTFRSRSNRGRMLDLFVVLQSIAYIICIFLTTSYGYWYN